MFGELLFAPRHSYVEQDEPCTLADVTETSFQTCYGALGLDQQVGDSATYTTDAVTWAGGSVWQRFKASLQTKNNDVFNIVL